MSLRRWMVMRTAAMQGGGAAATPWYLAGGVDPANAIGAWQAEGAASQAASYVNLANPGTFDLVKVGAGEIGWNAVTGWAGVSGNLAALDTGIVATNNTWTYLAKFSAAVTADILMGWSNGGQNMWLFPVTGADRRYDHGGTNTVVGGAVTSGTMCIAGPNCYLNGVADGVITQAAVTGISCYLLARNKPGIDSSFDGNGHYAAIYNTTLSLAQVVAITSSINP